MRICNKEPLFSRGDSVEEERRGTIAFFLARERARKQKMEEEKKAYQGFLDTASGYNYLTEDAYLADVRVDEAVSIVVDMLQILDERLEGDEQGGVLGDAAGKPPANSTCSSFNMPFLTTKPSSTP